MAIHKLTRQAYPQRMWLLFTCNSHNKIDFFYVTEDNHPTMFSFFHYFITKHVILISKMFIRKLGNYTRKRTSHLT